MRTSCDSTNCSNKPKLVLLRKPRPHIVPVVLPQPDKVAAAVPPILMGRQLLVWEDDSSLVKLCSSVEVGALN